MFHSLPNPRGGRRVLEAWRVGGPRAGAGEVVTERRGDSWSRPGKAAPSTTIRLTRHSISVPGQSLLKSPSRTHRSPAQRLSHLLWGCRGHTGPGERGATLLSLSHLGSMTFRLQRNFPCGISGSSQQRRELGRAGVSHPPNRRRGCPEPHLPRLGSGGTRPLLLASLMKRARHGVRGHSCICPRSRSWRSPPLPLCPHCSRSQGRKQNQTPGLPSAPRMQSVSCILVNNGLRSLCD